MFAFFFFFFSFYETKDVKCAHESDNVCWFVQARDFWREAQILSNLHHPNVLAFYGIVPDGAGGTLATVTEYMVNGSLRHVLVKNYR